MYVRMNMCVVYEVDDLQWAWFPWQWLQDYLTCVSLHNYYQGQHSHVRWPGHPYNRSLRMSSHARQRWERQIFLLELEQAH